MIGSPKSFISRHENHSTQFHKDVRVQNLYKESFLEHFLQIPKINLIEFRVHLFELGQKVMHVRYQTNVHRLNYQDHRSLLSVHMQSANVHGQSANYSCQNAILVCQTALLMCQTAILHEFKNSFHRRLANYSCQNAISTRHSAMLMRHSAFKQTHSAISINIPFTQHYQCFQSSISS